MSDVRPTNEQMNKFEPAPQGVVPDKTDLGPPDAAKALIYDMQVAIACTFSHPSTPIVLPSVEVIKWIAQWPIVFMDFYLNVQPRLHQACVLHRQWLAQGASVDAARENSASAQPDINTPATESQVKEAVNGVNNYVDEKMAIDTVINSVNETSTEQLNKTVIGSTTGTAIGHTNTTNGPINPAIESVNEPTSNGSAVIDHPADKDLVQESMFEHANGKRKSFYDSESSPTRKPAAKQGSVINTPRKVAHWGLAKLRQSLTSHPRP